MPMDGVALKTTISKTTIPVGPTLIKIAKDLAGERNTEKKI